VLALLLAMAGAAAWLVRRRARDTGHAAATPAR
jgi:hypothetical protein